jgi:hypothetical protein
VRGCLKERSHNNLKIRRPDVGIRLICRLIEIRLLWAGLLLLYILPGYPQNYRISTVLPYLHDDSLKVAISLENFPEGKIRKTLLAGIPLNLGLTLTLLNSTRQPIDIRKFNGKILYDVWEEHFQIKGLGKNNPGFNSLEQLEKWFADLSGLTLVRASRINDDNLYQVKADMNVILLGKKQGQELSSWLRKSNQTEEDIATEERSTGFRLNLNQLIQLFFSGEDKQEIFQASAFSAKFSIRDLTYP